MYAMEESMRLIDVFEGENAALMSLILEEMNSQQGSGGSSHSENNKSDVDSGSGWLSKLLQDYYQRVEIPKFIFSNQKEMQETKTTTQWTTIRGSRHSQVRPCYWSDKRPWQGNSFLKQCNVCDLNGCISAMSSAIVL